jgi:N-acetylglucosamine-6-sulfatase
MSRSEFLRKSGTATAALAAAAMARGRAGGAAQAGRPNLLLILTDDQQFWTFSERFMPKTMNLLARRGLRLRGYVNDPLCTPSRADILTGRYTHNHGLTSNSGPNGGEDTFRARGLDRDTIATRIKAAGYRTAYVGKYMNSYKGTYVPPGWDRWFAMVGDSSKEGSYTVNSGGNLRTLNRDKHNETREFWRVAKDFVASNRSVPWFCYVGIHSPHGPYYPLNDHAFDGISLYNAPSRGEEDMGDKPAFLRRLPRPSKEDIKGWRKDYEGKVEELQEVDDLVAEVLGTLAATGQLANTYVLFATDNGYMMGEHRIDAKGAPYEEATRTPFVVRGPGVAQGANSSALVGLIDLPPTLCQLAGASTDGFDGRSLVPLLGGGVPDTWRKHLFVEHYPGHRFRMLRSDRYVYVEYPGTNYRELYDMSNDPNQLRSLHRDAGKQPLMADFSSRLARFAACSGESCRAAEV